jgi:hypothetical protein
MYLYYRIDTLCFWSMPSVDRHQLIDGEKTICNWPHTVNKSISKDDNEWQYVCLFTVLTYHHSLFYIYASARSEGIICMLWCRSVRFFFSLKAYTYKKILFEEYEEEREKEWEFMFEADGQMRMNKKIDKQRSDRSTTRQTLFRYWSWMTSPWHHHYHYHHCNHYQHGISRTWKKRKKDSQCHIKQ